MKFSGRLQIEADPRNWLKTELDVSQGRLELVSGDELLGSWSTGQVKAERLEGDRFQLQLGADRAVFAADDALAFSYEALPVLAKKSVLGAATGLRDKLRKGNPGTDRAVSLDPEVDPAQANHHQPVPKPVEVHEEQTFASSSATPPTRRLRDLIQEAVKNNAANAAAEAQNIQSQSQGEQPVAVVPVVGDPPDSVPGEIEAVDPRQLAPAVSEPPRVETARIEPPRVEPARVEPARIDPPRVEPARADPPRVEPARVEPARADPPRIEPARAEMIDRVGALRPLFEVDRSARAARDDSVARPGATPPQPSLTTGPSDVVVQGPFPPLRPVAGVPSPGLRLTLDALIEEVRKGEMSPMQIIAVTDLVRAVAEAIEDRNRA